MSLFWKEAKESGFDSVCAIDFEGSDRTGVVEFGFVVFGYEGIRKVRTELCLPRKPISVREVETHGLEGADCVGAQPFAGYWEVFRGLRASGPLLAHSAGVEDRFLRRQWPLVGEVPDWAAVGSFSSGWAPWLDSCRLARSVSEGGSAGLRPVVEGWGLKEHLEELSDHYCPKPRQRWHAALYDALASVLVFERVLEARPGWGLHRVFRESAASGSEGKQGSLW